MTPPPVKVTTRDVARHAGVSQPTVSLVLGNNPRARVASATRERVIRAAAELGYRPNLLARGLVQRRSYALGVLIPDLANPFYVDVVSGVERVASAEGYAVLLCDSRETAPVKHLDALRGRQIDGIIIDALGAAALPDGSLAHLNVVLIDQPAGRWPGVASDAAAAGRLAAEHLIGLGHRDLALIGPAADVHTFRMRERGFVGALRQAGIAIPSEWLRRAAPTVAGGQVAMRALLARDPRPTGVFCANDLVALGALKACHAAGARVPEQMSLVGCDDIEMARIVTPELTTVAVPAREIGARAARLLLRTLADKPANRSSRLLPVRLLVRGTTAAPRSADVLT